MDNAKFGADRVFSAKPCSVFVFGSNLAGLHGGGAAKTAYKKYGAEWGRGFGFMGPGIDDCYCYGIPTKDHNIKTMTITEIAYWVDEFHEWTATAVNYPEIFVTKIGCGLAGYREAQIAPLFARRYWYSNVTLPVGWRIR